MNEWAVWLLAATALVGGAVAGAVGWRGRARTAALGATPSAALATLTMKVPPDCLATETAEVLVKRIALQPLIATIRRECLTTPGNFDQYYLPVLERVIEFAQCLPASEAHHHANPGGMVLHILESTAFSLQKRKGMMLPRGAAPERQSRLEHRWTYGVLVAALLHEVGKPFHDLRVTYFDGSAGTGKVWNPLAGTLLELQAHYYHVDFQDPSARNYATHQRLPIALLQRFVPQPAMQWLAEEPDLMRELMAYLSGESSAGSAIAELVKAGDCESVRRNLLAGPRTRFATARTVPLIERLMSALRRMLAEGAALPLNRSGAAGWIHDDKVWLVAKRLADEVRAYLQAHESAQGVPGDDRNDRLFDTWQEMGACLLSPTGGGAVWRVRIEGEGYTHDLSVLCFPVKLLYQNPDLVPVPMRGRIVPLGQSLSEAPLNDVPAPEPAPAVPAESVAEPAVAASPAGGAMSRGERVAKATSNVVPLARPVERKPSQTPRPTIPKSATMAAAPAAAPVTPAARPAADARTALPEDESATAELRRMRSAAASSPVRPVAPAEPALPALKAEKRRSREPSEEAIHFMQWLQRGLATGTLLYNQSGAMVHFVDGGMLLISPAIFRHYETECGLGASPEGQNGASRVGYRTQREVCNAGWNEVLQPGNTNILRYQVMRRGGQPGSYLSGVLIRDPKRFVDPVPANNPAVVRVAATAPPAAAVAH